MKDLIENGLQWLSRKQKQFASSPVTYYRDGEEYQVSAVLGRTDYEITDENGFTLAAHITDFLISGAEITFDPKCGDRILYRENIYEVIDLGNGTAWTWCEPHHIRRRIHTQFVERRQ